MASEQCSGLIEKAKDLLNFLQEKRPEMSKEQQERVRRTLQILLKMKGIEGLVCSTRNSLVECCSYWKERGETGAAEADIVNGIQNCSQNIVDQLPSVKDIQSELRGRKFLKTIRGLLKLTLMAFPDLSVQVLSNKQPRGERTDELLDIVKTAQRGRIKDRSGILTDHAHGHESGTTPTERRRAKRYGSINRYGRGRRRP